MRIFKEEQKFTQPWLVALLLISAIVPAILLTKELLDGTVEIINYISLVLLIVFASSLIFFFKLKTRIDATGIHYQFFPFHRKFITKSWTEISSVTVQKYDPITDYGGWGLKKGSLWNQKKGDAMNVKGDIGIQIHFKNGKKLLIGTQKKEEVLLTLKNYKNKIE